MEFKILTFIPSSNAIVTDLNPKTRREVNIRRDIRATFGFTLRQPHGCREPYLMFYM